MEKLVKQVAETLAQSGILFADPQLVGRGTYVGGDVIAKNSSAKEHGDERGYCFVEVIAVMSLLQMTN